MGFKPKGHLVKKFTYDEIKLIYISITPSIRTSFKNGILYYTMKNQYGVRVLLK